MGSKEKSLPPVEMLHFVLDLSSGYGIKSLVKCLSLHAYSHTRDKDTWKVDGSVTFVTFVTFV